MTESVIVQHRLASQQIARTSVTKPGDLVAWFGAVQAQDYGASKWALGLRLPNATDATIEQAIADKSIIRTWAMRGTLHLIAAEDSRWMLSFLRPRLRVATASHVRKLDLNETVLAKSYAALIGALQGGKQLTRPELKAALEQAGMLTHELRLNFLLVLAAIDGLICCGVRRGKAFTYTLLDEWISATKSLERDEALCELTKRYFMSHGPATLQDFVWWSGLTITEAKDGISRIKSQLLQETIDGQTYWMGQYSSVLQADPALAVHLLPSFDEYLVGYKDRSAALGTLDFKQIVSAGNGIFSPVVVVDGRVVGTWKRTIKKDSVSVQTILFYPLTEVQNDAITLAARRYTQFNGMLDQSIS